MRRSFLVLAVLLLVAMLVTTGEHGEMATTQPTKAPATPARITFAELIARSYTSGCHWMHTPCLSFPFHVTQSAWAGIVDTSSDMTMKE